MDHVRGSSLAWPASLETLRPFIVTWWSGRTLDDMPPDISAVYTSAGFRESVLNLGLVALNSKGEVLSASVPWVQPPSFNFDPEAQGTNFKTQLDELLAGLKLPTVERPIEPKLTLPTVTGPGQPSGVRIFLTFAENRLNHYRTPIVEAVPMNDDLRKSLKIPSGSGKISATKLRPWLEQFYPAAIMDGKGGFRRIEGDLKFTPAGSDSTYRYAVIEGVIDFMLDNVSESQYRGNLSLVLKYRRSDNDLFSIRGVCVSEIPKGPETIRMTAAIESLPK